MVNFGPLVAEIGPVVWGTPATTSFASWQRYCTVLCSGRQPNVAAFNRGRHLYSAGRPSRWASNHILVLYKTLFLLSSWHDDIVYCGPVWIALLTWVNSFRQFGRTWTCVAYVLSIVHRSEYNTIKQFNCIVIYVSYEIEYRLCIYTINLPNDVTVGGAYDGGWASQGHVIYCSGR